MPGPGPSRRGGRRLGRRRPPALRPRPRTAQRARARRHPILHGKREPRADRRSGRRNGNADRRPLLPSGRAVEPLPMSSGRTAERLPFRPHRSPPPKALLEVPSPTTLRRDQPPNRRRRIADARRPRPATDPRRRTANRRGARTAAQGPPPNHRRTRPSRERRWPSRPPIGTMRSHAAMATVPLGVPGTRTRAGTPEVHSPVWRRSVRQPPSTNNAAPREDSTERTARCIGRKPAHRCVAGP
jgi:hypothetical protein